MTTCSQTEPNMRVAALACSMSATKREISDSMRRSRSPSCSGSSGIPFLRGGVAVPRWTGRGRVASPLPK